MTHTCNPSYSEGRDQEDPGSKPAQANRLGNPISKTSSTKKGQQMYQVVEYLPCKCETLSSNRSTTTKKKKKSTCKRLARDQDRFYDF
jgi:hypothetical protein